MSRATPAERGTVLEVGGARAAFDLDRGARLASLVVGGHELLVGPEVDELRWGCYPMVPWAGRIRDGRFRFGGEEHQLPRNLPPHAIHGTGFTSAWQDRNGVMTLDLDDPWPFPATVEQRAVLTPDRLSMELRLLADDQATPAMLGWHPWFRRTIGGVDAELTFDAGAMFEVDSTLIPSGRCGAPTPPPWDNTFTDVTAGPVISWPGVLRLELRSSCRFWTVYTEPEHALCVEPQTEAPDVFNRLPPAVGEGPIDDAALDESADDQSVIVWPGESMVATFTIAWSRTADRGEVGGR